jgi:putative transposase
MARPLRIHFPGAVYHVMARGNAKESIFTDDQDYSHFMELLPVALDRFGVSCHAYTVLYNHYHLFLRVGALPLSRMMQQLNGAYARWFNRRHNRVGHVFQGRFKAKIVDDGVYTRNALRYIALNAVAAGRARTVEEWRWSSYRATVGLEAAPSFLSLEAVWAAFGAENVSDGQQCFGAFVAEGNPEALPPDALLVGSDEFKAGLQPLLLPHQQTRDYVYAERFAARPPLGAVVSRDTDRDGLKRSAYDAFTRHAYTLREIGDLIGRHPSTVWTWIHRARMAARGHPEIPPSALISAEV